MYIRITIYLYTTLFSHGARNIIDYQLVRKNVAETEESISYKSEEEKMGEHKQMDRLCLSKKPHKEGSSKEAAGYCETLLTSDQTERYSSPEKDNLRSRFTCVTQQ